MSKNMPRIRSSVIVGLGGTGALAALHAKRALTQFYEKIPYNVKFLILDTDKRRPMPLKVNIKGERWEVVKIEESEFLPLSVDDPLNLISVSDSIKYPNQGHSQRRWRLSGTRKTGLPRSCARGGVYHNKRGGKRHVGHCRS